MDLHQYRLAKLRREQEKPVPRGDCLVCRHPPSTCYCDLIQAFDCSLRFIILIHPGEVKRKLTTARMAHLCLSNSVFLEGVNFTENKVLNQILDDKRNARVVLFPLEDAIDLTPMHTNERKTIFPPDKQPVVIVLDGTWRQAKRMRRKSENLHPFPTIRFTPSSPSNFRIRKQPKEDCYCTIEAIHQLIELLAPEPDGAHKNLIQVFNSMVDKQIQFPRTHRNQRVCKRRIQKRLAETPS